ncbi:hypothetical protein SAMN04515668_0373 [Hymenobacter arizonensis]|uniref:Uncharacterized protein n=1 Tax=Hymenobacter arizonensis TaxID=1227077 RepID=A0A1I5T9G8_HYMAR|nr:hypothetical protein SAMN04515668_0373 [Hymenobacter arizonensis]
MPAIIEFVTPTEHQKLVEEVAYLRLLVADLLDSLDDEVNTSTALRLTGIKSRTTLIAERNRPETLLRYSSHGRSISYSRASCLAYKRAWRIKQ